MALPYQGGAQFPGPTGFSGKTMGWQIPGVLGFKAVDLSGGTTATKSTTTVSMPPPWNNSTPKRVGRVTWKLASSNPDTDDVLQGGLPNCPVAAILAALAHTSVGRTYLDGIITEYRGASIKTKLSPEIIKMVDASADDPDDKAQVPEILSDRYFKVPFWKGEIPDTFYIEYSDSDYMKPVFMGSPNQVLWPAVIEKACAYHYGSYKELGDYHKHNANEHWSLVVGKAPQGGFEIKDSTDPDKIADAARAASKIPTIGASREGASKVTPMHGFAILGMSGSSIDLYNPYGKHVALTPAEFRDSFQTILFGNP